MIWYNQTSLLHHFTLQVFKLPLKSMIHQYLTFHCYAFGKYEADKNWKQVQKINLVLPWRMSSGNPRQLKNGTRLIRIEIAHFPINPFTIHLVQKVCTYVPGGDFTNSNSAYKKWLWFFLLHANFQSRNWRPYGLINVNGSEKNCSIYIWIIVLSLPWSSW